MRRDGNFNLFRALGFFRKEIITAQRNANDISARLHITKEENATSRVSTSKLMSFTNGEVKNLHGQNEFGSKEANILEQKLSGLS